MRIYLNEKLHVVLIPGVGIGRWLCKPVNVELVEMNTLCVNGVYYERGQTVGGLLRLHEIKDQEAEKALDDFDTEIQCEEVYHEDRS